MSITFQCQSCRATHRAKAEHAGRRAKCPSCGEVLTVPHAAANGQSPQSATVDAAGQPNTRPLSVMCGCGKSFQARHEHAGRRATCPACGGVLTIPNAATTESQTAVASLLDEEMGRTPSVSAGAGPTAKQEQVIVAAIAESPAEKRVVCPHCDSVVRGDGVMCSVCHLPLAMKKRESLKGGRSWSEGKWFSLLITTIATTVCAAVFLPLGLHTIGAIATFLVFTAMIFWASVLLACGVFGEDLPDFATAGKLVAACMIMGGATRLAFAGAGLAAGILMPALVCAIVFCLLMDVPYVKGVLIYLVAMIFSFILTVVAVTPTVLVTGFSAIRSANDSDMSVGRRLKEIGIGMHLFQQAHRCFPGSASYDKQGKPLLSWRVHILPYIEQDALYKQFHLNEPWDSPHNIKLLERMPEVYGSHYGKQDGTTRMMVFTGPGTPFQGKNGPSLAALVDGASYTIMVVEAGTDKAVPWTRPQDLTLDPANPQASLGGVSPSGFMAVFFNAEVRRITSKISPTMLRCLIDPADHRPVDFNHLE
jgi:ribosomal protein S27E